MWYTNNMYSKPTEQYILKQLCGSFSKIGTLEKITWKKEYVHLHFWRDIAKLFFKIPCANILSLITAVNYCQSLGLATWQELVLVSLFNQVLGRTHY